MTKNGLFLSAGTIYDPENAAHRKELGDKMTEKLGAIGFTLSGDRTLDPGRYYGGGFKGKEQVYVFKHRKDPGLEVQVFTSVLESGSVRGKGADAIRVCLIYKNKAKQQNPESEEARQYDLGSGCRVYRTGDIDDIVTRTVERAREMYKLANAVERCNYCQAPLATSKQGKKFCSEVCWTKRPGYTKASAIEAAADKPIARTRAKSLIDSQIDADDDAVHMLSGFVNNNSNWPFFAPWPERLWKNFLTMINGMIGQVASGALEAEEDAGKMAKKSVSQAEPPTSGEVGAATLGEHPDMLEGKDTAVVLDWKAMSPADLKMAANSNKLTSDEIDEIAEWQDRAEKDGDVEALLAEGVNQELADAIAAGLADDLYQASEALREKAIEDFVKYWTGYAESDLEYITNGDGHEHMVDWFQQNLDSNVDDYVSKVMEFLEEDEYPKFEQVTDEMLKEVLSDPSNYKFDFDKSGSYYRRGGDRVLWSTGVGSQEHQHEGAEYDDELAEILRPLSDEDIKSAVQQLGDNSPYVYFGSNWRRKVVDKEYFTSGSINYSVNECDEWRFEASPNMDAIIEALDEVLGDAEAKTPIEADDVVYKFSGTNDTVAGASSRGMYVAALRPNQLGKEGANLGICVGRKDMPYCRNLKAGEIRIFSVRTEAGKPKFTIEEAVSGPVIKQVKGKANRVPGFESGSTQFSKPDEVRLVVEFLLHRGYTPEKIRTSRDIAPGVRAMEDMGNDPFSPPKSKKSRELQANNQSAPISQAARVLLLKALACPWGFDVQAAIAERAVVPRDVVHYPEFEEWLGSLKDKAAVDTILRRINRIKDTGSFGDYKTGVRPGLHELRFDMGPGYRVYFMDRLPKSGKPTVVLLTGGTKKSQDSDIEHALRLIKPADVMLEVLNKKKDEEVTKKTFKDYGSEFMPKPMFADVSDAELLAGGVPEQLIAPVRRILSGDEDALLTLVDQIKDERAASFLLETALGDQASAVSASVRVYCKLIEVRSKGLVV